MNPLFHVQWLKALTKTCLVLRLDSCVEKGGDALDLTQATGQNITHINSIASGFVARSATPLKSLKYADKLHFSS